LERKVRWGFRKQVGKLALLGKKKKEEEKE